MFSSLSILFAGCTMFKNRLFHIIKTAYRLKRCLVVPRIRYYAPVSIGLITTAYCGENRHTFTWEDITLEGLEHEFLIRQATTVNVNAATQLLTVTLVAIQDTSERLVMFEASENLLLFFCLLYNMINFV